MPTLEQTLSEVEPILREVDGKFGFSHPSFQEVLTAKEFAEEINSGALSVKEAYEQFWSYTEQKPKPDKRLNIGVWERVFNCLPGLLEETPAKEFVKILFDSFYKSYKRYLDTWRKRDNEEEDYSSKIADLAGQFLREYFLHNRSFLGNFENESYLIGKGIDDINLLVLTRLAWVDPKKVVSITGDRYEKIEKLVMKFHKKMSETNVEKEWNKARNRRDFYMYRYLALEILMKKLSYIPNIGEGIITNERDYSR